MIPNMRASVAPAGGGGNLRAWRGALHYDAPPRAPAPENPMHARIRPLVLALTAALAATAHAGAPAAAAPPATAKGPVTDTYHGVSVVDDYRWLEDWNDPKVKAWSEAQNQFSRARLDALPGRQAIRERVTAIMSASTIRYRALSVAGGKVFALKSEPPKQQPFLVVMDAAPKTDLPEPATERVVLDPGALDAKGTTAIDWFVPSPDGTKIAVSMSSGGSESGDVHVFDVSTGKDLNDTVPRVNGGTAGGSLAWAPDGKRFYYTRYPRGTERPEADMAFYLQVYSHTLGTPTEKDTYEIGKDFPRIAEIQLASDPKDGRVLATVQKGDGGEFAVYVRSPKGAWQAVADFPDRIVQAALGPKNGLFVISRKDAPLGKVQHLTVTPGKAVDLSKAKEIVAQGKETIVSDFWDQNVMVVTPTRLYLTFQLGGPSELRVFEHAGKSLPTPPQPPVAATGHVTPAQGDRVLFETTSYISPPAWSLYDPKSGKVERTALAVKPPVDFDDSEVVREFATSKDGTKIPVNIVRRKGIALDGSHPVLITGYGGYAISMTPGFSAPDRVLVEQGFVLAEANIRGGAEYGDAWHDQGRLTHKQNVFDDFAAAVRHMTERGYTKPERTVIIGGSNGGLLMGATFTQNPQICRAVVSFVGMYDMLRSELSANGEFNVPEFGTVKDPAQFKALYAYSPYHRVVDGTKYPDVLFLTGANDPRVDPAESRKMTARMQAASPASLTLLRTSASSGHGIGTALGEKIEETVDVDSFIFAELGLTYRPVTPAK
jgi:prolyl oligopeptidase